MKTLIDEAHERGIKVFFDIITNHTADVLDYPAASTTPAADHPVHLQGRRAVPRRGRQRLRRPRLRGRATTFPEVDADDVVPVRADVPQRGRQDRQGPGLAERPDALPQPRDSTFAGENSEYGDFPSAIAALDDLWTEHPRSSTGMTDIYKTWVQDVGIDGFRIDTVKHVNMEFWQQFSPALQGYAASLGNDDFFMFGEVFDANPAFMSQYTTEGRLQATRRLRLPGAARRLRQGRAGTHVAARLLRRRRLVHRRRLQRLPAADLPRQPRHGPDRQLPRATRRDRRRAARSGQARPLADVPHPRPAGRLLRRRAGLHRRRRRPGRPRRTCSPSKVASYNDDDLIGTNATTAEPNYDTSHPLYQHIADARRARAEHPTLADGAQVQRYAADGPGIFAFSRIDGRAEARVRRRGEQRRRRAQRPTFPTYSANMHFLKKSAVGSPRGGVTASGVPQVRSDGDGRSRVTVPARSVVVYRAAKALPANDQVAPTPAVTSPAPGALVEERTRLRSTCRRTTSSR